VEYLASLAATALCHLPHIPSLVILKILVLSMTRNFVKKYCASAFFRTTAIFQCEPLAFLFKRNFKEI
jgi:hypothetical protein